MINDELDIEVVSDTRERIVLAARRLFAERGYSATAMAAIADEANVVRATVYNSFSDKIDILATRVRRYMKGYVAIGDALRSEPVANRSTFEQLEAMTRMALEWRVANRDLRGAIDVARHLPGSAWDEANAEADEALLEWISQVHERGERLGLTHPGLDLSVATPAVYSMIEAALSNFDVLTPPERMNHVARQLTMVHWHAIYCVPADADASR
ncbi:MAG: TetR/AcrR family transcriptional regulator [Actinobacteria bacterium]|nr:TetR/AcrR family transcriptional regulator [Actinomycetota bacterium]